MKKILSVVLFLFIILFISPNTKHVYAQTEATITLGENFTVTDENGTIITGKITLNGETNYRHELMIPKFFRATFKATVTYNLRNGEKESVYIDENLEMLVKDKLHFGENNCFLHFSDSRMLNMDIYSTEVDFNTTLTLTNNYEIKDAIVNIKQPKTLKKSNSKQTDRIYWTVNSKYRETDELDDEDGEPIKVYYLKDLEKWIKDNITITSDTGESLNAWIITFSKNITNLKYGTKNATVKIEVDVADYNLITIPVTISYYPELKVQDVTKTKIKLVPINQAEYSIDGTNWQKSSKFTKLKKNTEYTVYVRQKNDIQGTSISSIIVTTENE